MTRTHNRLIWATVSALGAAAISLGVFGFSVSRQSNWLQLNMQFYVTDRLWTTFGSWVLTPQFAGVLVACLVLQMLMPARPREKTFSVYFAQDVVWFVYHDIMLFFVISTYVFYLKAAFAEHLSFLTFHGFDEAPASFRFLFGILLYDFLFWLQHYLNHKVPIFWEFHKLHHSAKELNFFTDFRYHGVEYIVRHTVLAIPFLMLDFDVPTIVVYTFVSMWISRFYHCNIKTNLGPLRYLLVTPQSHRMHHANDVDYRDMNYGSIFSIWDFAFGTQNKNFDDYPETGIDDDAFPMEERELRHRLFFTPAIQMIYCFKSAGTQFMQAIKPTTV